MDELFTGVGGLAKTQGDYITASADIFQVGPQEKATKYGRESVYRPTSENADGPWEFYLPAEGDTYTEPDSFRLTGYTQLKKISANGDLIDLVAADDAAPINFVAGMALRTKEVSIQGHLVNYATQPLEYFKAYIENLMSYGSDTKKTVLKGCCNWIPDEPGEADDVTGSGYTKRKALWALSAKVPFCIPLQIDILATDRFFPKDIDFHFRLTKSNDNMLYMANKAKPGRYKLLISDMKLHVRKLTMTKELLADHDAKFNKGQLATFPFTRTDIKYMSIAVGSTVSHMDNIYRSKLPQSAIVFLVSSQAINGSPQHNVQNFQNFGVTKMRCLINSEEVPCGGYTQNYTTEDYCHTYRRFFDNTGVRTNNIGNNITPEMFANGSCMYAFDFSPDQCNGFHDHIDMAGKVEIEVNFDAPTTEAISMVILSQYDDRLVLDGARNVINRGEPMAIA